MFGKNKTSRINVEYKKHEKKLIKKALEKKQEKQEKDFENRNDLFDFLATFHLEVTADDFQTEGAKKVFNFLNEECC